MAYIAQAFARGIRNANVYAILLFLTFPTTIFFYNLLADSPARGTCHERHAFLARKDYLYFTRSCVRSDVRKRNHLLTRSKFLEFVFDKGRDSKDFNQLLLEFIKHYKTIIRQLLNELGFIKILLFSLLGKN